MMKKIIKSAMICLALLGLVACSAFDFFIERSINNFEENSANRMKRYAEFDESQEIKIDQLAAAIDDWMRTQRLSKVSDALLIFASEIEQHGKVTLPLWRDTYYQLEQGLLLSQAPHIIDGFTELAFTLSDEQEQAVLETMDRRHERRLNDDDDDIAERNRETISNVNWLFRASGRSLKRAEKDEAVRILSLAKYDRDSHLKQSRARIDTLQKLIVERDPQSADFKQGLEALWVEAEQPDHITDPETAEHNLMIAYQCMTYLLSVLEEDNREDMAQVLRDYAVLFSELAKS